MNNYYYSGAVINKAVHNGSIQSILSFPIKDISGDYVRPDGGDWTKYPEHPVVNWAHEIPVGRGGVKMQNLMYEGHPTPVPIGDTSFFSTPRDVKGIDLTEYDSPTTRNPIGKYTIDQCLKAAEESEELVRNDIATGVSIEFVPNGYKGEPNDPDAAYWDLGEYSSLNGRNARHFEKWTGLGYAHARLPVNPGARILLPENAEATEERERKCIEIANSGKYRGKTLSDVILKAFREPLKCMNRVVKSNTLRDRFFQRMRTRKGFRDPITNALFSTFTATDASNKLDYEPVKELNANANYHASSAYRIANNEKDYNRMAEHYRSAEANLRKAAVEHVNMGHYHEADLHNKAADHNEALAEKYSKIWEPNTLQMRSMMSDPLEATRSARYQTSMLQNPEAMKHSDNSLYSARCADACSDPGEASDHHFDAALAHDAVVESMKEATSHPSVAYHLEAARIHRQIANELAEKHEENQPDDDFHVESMNNENPLDVVHDHLNNDKPNEDLLGKLKGDYGMSSDHIGHLLNTYTNIHSALNDGWDGDNPIEGKCLQSAEDYIFKATPKANENLQPKHLDDSNIHSELKGTALAYHLRKFAKDNADNDEVQKHVKWALRGGKEAFGALADIAKKQGHSLANYDLDNMGQHLEDQKIVKGLLDKHVKKTEGNTDAQHYGAIYANYGADDPSDKGMLDKGNVKQLRAGNKNKDKFWDVMGKKAAEAGLQAGNSDELKQRFTDAMHRIMITHAERDYSEKKFPTGKGNTKEGRAGQAAWREAMEGQANRNKDRFSGNRYDNLAADSDRERGLRGQAIHAENARKKYIRDRGAWRPGMPQPPGEGSASYKKALRERHRMRISKADLSSTPTENDLFGSRTNQVHTSVPWKADENWLSNTITHLKNKGNPLGHVLEHGVNEGANIVGAIRPHRLSEKEDKKEVNVSHHELPGGVTATVKHYNAGEPYTSVDKEGNVKKMMVGDDVHRVHVRLSHTSQNKGPTGNPVSLTHHAEMSFHAPTELAERLG